MTPTSDPHAGQPVRRAGPEPSQARVALIAVHGRHGSADNMLALAARLALDDVLVVAPQAAGQTWYPYSFLSPLERNEPGLTSGLRVLDGLIAMLASEGVPVDRVALLGFSQGACLSLEYAARHPRRYHAVIGLSGGVIGPPDAPRRYEGDMSGTPVFLGCSDVDAHIPVERVHETAAVFRTLNAAVDARIYPGMGHLVNDDELEAAREILSGRR